MTGWRDVTEKYTEEERKYDDTYLEKEETYGNTIGMSLFSTLDRGCEICFSFGEFYGIVYAMANRAYQIYEEMKTDLAEAAGKMKEPTPDFKDWFTDKYKVCLPADIFFSPGYTPL